MNKISSWIACLALIVCAPAYSQNYIGVSVDFFNAVKNKKPNAGSFIKVLAEADQQKLKTQLNTEDKAKAFWITLYNTVVQYSLANNPKQFEDRSKFFKSEQIRIAGVDLSLDDIEHGIIRRSKNKYSLGYVGKISVSDFEKKFRLAKVDYRIHFALNCGAKSCPPIALYEAEKLNAQLDKSTALYLKKTMMYDANANTAKVPVLCSWFKADFDGEDGVRKMLVNYKLIPSGKEPGIDYLDYDWTLLLNNYIDL